MAASSVGEGNLLPNVLSPQNHGSAHTKIDDILHQPYCLNPFQDVPDLDQPVPGLLGHGSEISQYQPQFLSYNSLTMIGGHDSSWNDPLMLFCDAPGTPQTMSSHQPAVISRLSKNFGVHMPQSTGFVPPAQQPSYLGQVPTSRSDVVPGHCPPAVDTGHTHPAYRWRYPQPNGYPSAIKSYTTPSLNECYPKQATLSRQQPTSTFGTNGHAHGCSAAAGAPYEERAAEVAEVVVPNAPCETKQEPAIIAGKRKCRPMRRYTGPADKHYTEMQNGRLFHRMNDEVDWYPAVKHGDVWDDLLREWDSKSYYRIQQVEGITPGDRTAVVPGHENWGPDRAHRPDELFMLYEPEEVAQRASKPGRLTLGPNRVIDRNGKWMKHWDDVPVTFCSLVPGWYLEAIMRRNPGLTIYDIQVRFKDSFLYYDYKKKTIVTQYPWRGTALTNRMMRFRMDTFNLTWRGVKDGSTNIESFFLSILPEKCVGTNSTYEHRDLSTEEEGDLKMHLDRMRQPRKKGKKARLADKAQGPAVSVQDGSDINVGVAHRNRSSHETIGISDSSDATMSPWIGKQRSVSFALENHIARAVSQYSASATSTKEGSPEEGLVDQEQESHTATPSHETGEDLSASMTQDVSYAAAIPLVWSPKENVDVRSGSRPTVQSSPNSPMEGKTYSCFHPDFPSSAGLRFRLEDGDYLKKSELCGDPIISFYPEDELASFGLKNSNGMKGTKRQRDGVGSFAASDAEMPHAKPDGPSKRMRWNSNAGVGSTSRGARQS